MLSIQELSDRYDLSRDRIYVRKKHLDSCGVDTVFVKEKGKSYATQELVKIFDDLNDWIKSGNAMINFRPTITPEVVVVEQDNLPKQDNARQNKTTQNSLTELEQMTFLTKAIAEAIQPTASNDPLNYIDRLLMLAENKILITKKEIKKLIGVNPKGDRFVRGSFVFVKSGKIGNQFSYLVERNQDLTAVKKLSS